jgi:hypothetical protein
MTFFIIFKFFHNLFFTLDVRDTSGLKLYVTQNYRPTELGILTVGSALESLVLPPKAERFDNTDFVCRKQCMDVNEK